MRHCTDMGHIFGGGFQRRGTSIVLRRGAIALHGPKDPSAPRYTQSPLIRSGR